MSYGIFDRRVFGGRETFGGRVPTELNPSRVQPIAPVPGQVITRNPMVPVQAVQTQQLDISRVARPLIQHPAPNFPAGAVYNAGAARQITAVAPRMLPVTARAAAALAIGPAQQVFQGFGSPDGLGGLVGFGG